MEGKQLDFQEKVLRELEKQEIASKKAMQAELAALLNCMIQENGGEEGTLKLHSSRTEAWNRLFTLIKKTYNITVEFDSADAGQEEGDSAGNGQSMVFQGEAAERIGSMRQLPASFEKDEKCVRGWLAGVFLCVGCIRRPEKEYYLSFDVRNEEQSVMTMKLLRQQGITLRPLEHGRSHGLVTRDSAVIVDVLNLLGAHVSMMEMENTRIVRQVRGKINRKVNCETANIMKTVAASRKQMEQIALLRESSVWDTLPDTLQQMAILREQYPDSSLQELGQRMNPPVGKSGVNHRLRRLAALAEQLQEERAADPLG